MEKVSVRSVQANSMQKYLAFARLRSPTSPLWALPGPHRRLCPKDSFWIRPEQNKTVLTCKTQKEYHGHDKKAFIIIVYWISYGRWMLSYNNVSRRQLQDICSVWNICSWPERCLRFLSAGQQVIMSGYRERLIGGGSSNGGHLQLTVVVCLLVMIVQPVQMQRPTTTPRATGKLDTQSQWHCWTVVTVLH